MPLRTVLRPIFRRDERERAGCLADGVQKELTLRRRRLIMFRAVDKFNSRRHDVENAVVEIRQQKPKLVGAAGGISFVPPVEHAAELLEKREEEDHRVGILLENPRKDFAPALTREPRALLERRIVRRVTVLGRFGIIFMIEHQPLHSGLLRQPRHIRHILRIVRPCLVVRPAQPVGPVARRHPEKEETLAQMRLLGNRLQYVNLFFKR